MSIHTRYARQVIERLTGGNDPFNLERLTARNIAASILMEAWTPERRASIEAEALKNSTDMVDHLVIGDYDLTLWYTSKIEGEPPCYLVSINNADHSPLDVAAQTTKQTGSAGQLPVAAIRAKLAEWADKYGTLVIGSAVPERNKMYLKLVKRLMPGYHFCPFFNSYRYGFKLSKQ